jgi:hypothetical protein
VKKQKDAEGEAICPFALEGRHEREAGCCGSELKLVRVSYLRNYLNVIPAKLAIASASRNPEISKNLDARFRGNDD